MDVDSSHMVHTCRKCSAQSETDGDFCPNCGARFMRRRPIADLSRRTKLIAVAVAAVIVVGGIATAVVLKINHDNDVAAHKREVARKAAEAKKAADAKVAAEVELRKLMVTEMEHAITKDARKSVDDGLFDGPIKRTSCSAAAGQDIEDLGTSSAEMNCLAVNREKSDGTMEGYRFTASVDFDAGTYSWHLGGQ